MKVRIGFVTNSSSSSYVCLIRGRDECGYDLSLYDAGMSRCVNGHTICDHHVLPKLEEKEAMAIPDDDDDYNDRYDFPSYRCPICQLEAISDDMAFKFLIQKTGMDKDAILEEVRATFLKFGDEAYSMFRSSLRDVKA